MGPEEVHFHLWILGLRAPLLDPLLGLSSFTPCPPQVKLDTCDYRCVVSNDLIFFQRSSGPESDNKFCWVKLNNPDE